MSSPEAAVLTDTVMMVRPDHFRMNEQTARINRFQDAFSTAGPEIALAEFAGLVADLRARGVTVIEGIGDPKIDTPDAVFPNNWVSFHPEGFVLYPMNAENRRDERQMGIIRQVGDQVVIGDEATLDLSNYEQAKQFLEGTGSMVLDRANGVAYAALSERTMQAPLDHWAREMGYSVVAFPTEHPDDPSKPIYHTNVVMAIGATEAVICPDVIPDVDIRRSTLAALEQTHNVVPITVEQLGKFAGNMIELRGTDGRFWVMSQTAADSLTGAQMNQLVVDQAPVLAQIHNIETAGGGSARCMIAEVFPKTQ
jgi:hypothetical protein